MSSIVFADDKTWLLDRPYIMGVLNVTPDSFFSPSRVQSQKVFLSKVEQMIFEGVDIVDIGGVSTRPGAKPVSFQEERSRVVEKIATCKKEFPFLRISVDTTNVEIAREAADLGVDMINDISAGRFSDNEMFDVIKNYRLPMVLMHMLGMPATMQNNPFYKDGVGNAVSLFFDEKLEELDALGIPKEKIILDLGIGFGKKCHDNLTLFHKIPDFSAKGCGLLVGASMKRMLSEICEETVQKKAMDDGIDGDIPKNMAGATSSPDVEKRLTATIAVHLSAIFSGANMIRVHNVLAAKNAIKSFLFTSLPKNIPAHLRQFSEK